MSNRSANDMSSMDILSSKLMSTGGQDEISRQCVFEFQDSSAEPVDLLMLVRVKIDQIGVPP